MGSNVCDSATTKTMATYFFALRAFPFDWRARHIRSEDPANGGTNHRRAIYGRSFPSRRAECRGGWENSFWHPSPLLHREAKQAPSAMIAGWPLTASLPVPPNGGSGYRAASLAWRWPLISGSHDTCNGRVFELPGTHSAPWLPASSQGNPWLVSPSGLSDCDHEHPPHRPDL